MLSGVPKVEKRLGASFRPTNAPRKLGQSLLEAAPSCGAALAGHERGRRRPPD